MYREARFLDDKEWDGWLAMYAPDAEFWMPAWDDDKLVSDPAREVSLIYYAHKGGLEDRVFRIRTERSSATSLPEPRTSHNITNVEILEQSDGLCRLRFNWLTFNYGVTRFIEARPNGTVADASYRVGIIHPAGLPRRRLRHLQGVRGRRRI